MIIKQLQTTKKFNKDFAGLPAEIKKRTSEKLILFKQNPLHPSLRVKKMQGYPDLWEGSINMQYRFIFKLEDGCCILYRLGSHDILNSF